MESYLEDDGSIKLKPFIDPISSITVDRWLLAKDLREKRMELALNQLEFAKRMGLTNSQISNLERFVGSQPNLESYFKAILFLKENPFKYLKIITESTIDK